MWSLSLVMVQMLTDWWRYREKDGWSLARTWTAKQNKTKEKKNPESFPERISQSFCQMRIKCACIEATHCSHFDVIQFVLTAADKRAGNYLALSFFFCHHVACVNCLSAVARPCYINSPLWEHLRIRGTKRKCQRRRVEKSSKHCVWRVKPARVYSARAEGHGSDSLSIFITSRSRFMIYGTTFQTTSLAGRVGAELTAYLMIVTLWTGVQAASRLSASSQTALNLIQYFIWLH